MRRGLRAAARYSKPGSNRVRAKPKEKLELKIVGFGKHKGKRWRDVPDDYLEWLVLNHRITGIRDLAKKLLKARGVALE